MIGAHRMASLKPLRAEQIRHATSKRIEVNAAIIVVEEERVVECRRLPGQAKILVVAQHAIKNQVCEDRLFLLPPRLAVMPYKPIMFSVRLEHTLDYVVPSTALLIAARIRLERRHSHEVPCDLEIVTDYGAVLLPAPRLIVIPVFEETLLHERAMVIIRKSLRDRVEGVF